MKDEVDWETVNNLVKPEHQCKEVKSAPLDPIRMAWPFKTEGELELMRKWFRKEKARIAKQKQDEAGESLL